MININCCRLWRDTILSGSGKFWCWAVLRVDSDLFPNQSEDLLISSVLSKVPEIEISPNTSTYTLESLLQVVSKGKALKLEKITIGCHTDASQTRVAPDIMAGAAMKLERLDLKSQPSSVQLETILTRTATTQDSRLLELITYQEGYVSGMDPEILSQALVKLKCIGVSGICVKLSPDESISLFYRIRDSPDLRLNELGLDWDVSMVPPEVFAGAISRLETVRISRLSRVTPNQLESLYMKMISHQEEAGDSKLKQLKFREREVISFSSEGKFRITICTNRNTVESFLQVVSDGKIFNMKKITLAIIYLSHVTPEILAGAAVKLESLELESMPSSVQLEAILTRSAITQDSRLRKLSCYERADIPGMDPEILSQALVKLETVGGGFGFRVKLSPVQVSALFSRIRKSPIMSLTELEIDWDVSMVEPELFGGALSRLETVKFGYQARITSGQLESLLRMISQQEEAGGSKLKQLKFICTDLTSVSSEVLVGAIKKLEEVRFRYGKMTADQITSILNMLKENQKGRLKYVQIFRPSILGGSVSPSLRQQAKLNTSVKVRVYI